jgi:hypothetical protein
MRDKIGQAARQNKRTMNAEIIIRLERSFVETPALSLPEDVIRAISETREMVGALHHAAELQPGGAASNSAAEPPPDEKISNIAAEPPSYETVQVLPNLTISRISKRLPASQAKDKTEE